MRVNRNTTRLSSLLGLLLAIIGVFPSRLTAGDSNATEDDARSADVLRRFCIDCHSETEPEAGVRLDKLDLVGLQLSDGEMLARILDVVADRKMPPDDSEQPGDQERAEFLAWLEARIDRLAAEASAREVPSMDRRLTVEEYNFTMQQLFGVDARFDDMLPPDPLSEAGYRNDHRRLGLSSLQIEAYLDSARRAVDRYIQFRDSSIRPILYHIELEDLFYSTANRYATREKAPQPTDAVAFGEFRAARHSALPKYVEPLGPKLPGAFSEDETLRAAIPKLNQQYVAIPSRLPIGELTIRVRAAGMPDRDGRYPRMRVEAGITLGDGCSMDKRELGEIDVTARLDQPAEYEFRMRLEDVPTKGPMSDEESFDRPSVFDMDQVFISNVSSDSHAIFDLGRGGYADPETGSKKIAAPLKQMVERGCNFLYLDFLEIEMVPGHGGDNEPYRWRVPDVEPDAGLPGELKVASEFLGQFMPHAYRRPVHPVELETKLELFRRLRSQTFSFEESLRETLVATLVSPAFLFLKSTPPSPVESDSAGISPHHLAARLSYMLWLSPPDDRLRRLADDGTLLQRPVLLTEAKRLMDDPRSRRFLESFCRQWLRLDRLNLVGVNRDRYPGYDEDLANVSLRETLDYFVEVFTSGASALDLVDSDYAILNDRMAEHYGLTKINTGELHRISLPRSSVRGGLLTQASVMTMNSDGSDSHPIRRAVWLLDRILHQPPPAPPPNVPAIDEADSDFRGLSLKQRIEVHRRPSSCQNCHQRIDPWGIPFESLDATGRWREDPSSGETETGHTGETVISHIEPIDTATVLPDGTPIRDIVELKRHVRQQRGEQVADALVYHLLTYAMGRPPGIAERRPVKEIRQRFVESGLQLRELVLAIVESPLFYPQARGGKAKTPEPAASSDASGKPSLDASAPLSPAN